MSPHLLATTSAAGPVDIHATKDNIAWEIVRLKDGSAVIGPSEADAILALSSFGNERFIASARSATFQAPPRWQVPRHDILTPTRAIPDRFREAFKEIEA